MPLYTFPCATADYTCQMIGGARIDTSPLPVSEKAGRLEGTWLYHAVLLGTREDMDKIVDAMQKVWDHADDIKDL